MKIVRNDTHGMFDSVVHVLITILNHIRISPTRIDKAMQ